MTAVLFSVDYYLMHHGMLAGAAMIVLIKLGLIVALPVLLIVTGFFRGGEWRALRSAVRRGPISRSA